MVTFIIQTKEDDLSASPLATPAPLEAANFEEPVMVRPTTPALGRTGSTSDSDACRVSPAQSVGSSAHTSTSDTPSSPSSHPVIRGFSTSHIPIPQDVTSQPRPAPIDAISEPSSPLQKKQASFSKQDVARTFAPIMMDHNYSDVDESAIDDDDDSEWEDSNEESDKSSETLFKRVDSKVNLTSKRSLITLMLERNDRQTKLGNGASQSASAIHQGRMPRLGPSFVASPNDSDESSLMMKRASRAAQLKPINEIPRSAAQPIATPVHVNHQQAALSSRTTRRNMLSTELTESLRRDIVWERSQKSLTANAVLKRRHTSHNVANLKQDPERAVIKKENDINASSWDQYFAHKAFDGYHVKGW
ncbi:hypothetical protein ACKVWC_003438 [Pyricularia oryzae]